jgi:glycosyltransferase involved in cell wall biosynthesis
MDTRALAGGEASGIGRYILALQSALARLDGVDVIPFDERKPPIVGPQLVAPLRVRMAGADLIHGPANALPLAMFGLPGVVSIQDLAIYDHPDWFPSGQWFSTRVVVPRSIKRARAVIVPSQATRRSVIRLFELDPDRCVVIPHGVEAEFAQGAAPALRSDVRRVLGLPEHYWLQVGTVQPRKNHVTTLRAMARIPAEMRLPLVVVGTFGWSFDPVVAAVHDLDLSQWVRFLGSVRTVELPALYQMAEAVVFPSLDEGFGLPVLEGFAAGVPVVASNAGAIPEVAGEAALLSPPEDEAALAGDLVRLRTDAELRARLVEAGRARAGLFTWARSAAAHRSVYESVVG